jgi:Uma2 family endonuclease
LEATLAERDAESGRDLGPKCSLYARYGVCEYWVVDLIHEHVVTHHQPAQGAYQVTHRYGAGDALSARFFSDIHIAVGRLFGK